MFESLNNTSQKAVEKGNEFLKHTEAYYKLKLFQLVTTSLGLLVKFAIIGVFVLMVFVLLAMALSVSIGDYFNSQAIGYLATSLIFILLSFVTYAFRKHLENLIIRSLSIKFFAEDYDENI